MLAEFFTIMTAPDWIGVVGSLMIAGAYFAVSAGNVDAERPAFQLFNLVGALLVLWSLFYRPNPGAIVIEILWAGIAIYTLMRFIWRKK